MNRIPPTPTHAYLNQISENSPSKGLFFRTITKIEVTIIGVTGSCFFPAVQGSPFLYSICTELFEKYPPTYVTSWVDMAHPTIPSLLRIRFSSKV